MPGCSLSCDLFIPPPAMAAALNASARLLIDPLPGACRNPARYMKANACQERTFQ